MSLKSIVIDKEFTAVELISNYIAGFPSLTLLRTFEDLLAAAEFLRSNKVDLLFISLSYPFTHVINLVKSLQEKTQVIFLVSGKQLPTDILKLDALDYIVQPVSLQRFAKTVFKAMGMQEKTDALAASDDSIYLRSAYQLVKISINEMEYIESVENYIKIHLSTGKVVMTLMPLKTMIEKLPAGKFIRIHRSYVVACDKIKYVSGRKVKLDTIELPVGHSYSFDLKKLIK